MRRHEIEHLIRSAGAITESEEIIVIGSQSILGRYPDAPKELLVSREADLIPVQYPERADLIDGVMGELSPFDETFGYYADGVEESTAILPTGWKKRLVRVKNANTNNISGLFLEPHDLIVSKLFAGRSKDIQFVAWALRYSIVDKENIAVLIKKVQADDESIQVALNRLKVSVRFFDVDGE